MRVHLLANLFREDAIAAAKAIASWLVDRGVSVRAERESAERIGIDFVVGEEFADCDLVVSFGGDGTLLRASHLCSIRGTPILGVYFGRFGFVTQCHPDEVKPALDSFFAGRAQVDERMMLRSELVRSGRAVATIHCLNETAVQRAATSRMLTFEVRVDDVPVAEYPADGVLVATPTGSTAYSMSAGGPILDPSLRAMLLTAIMPHTLSSRPFVVREDATVALRINESGQAMLSGDGVSHLHLLGGDWVRVTRSERITRLLSVDSEDFLRKLSAKLLWHRGYVPEED